MNRIHLLAPLLLCLSMTGAHAETTAPRPAIPAPLASQALTLDIIRVGNRLLAVGERGHVLYSDDGRHWTQAASVPVQATLTRITHAGSGLWAVGHDTTIIHSGDGGENWTLQYFDPEAEQPLLDVIFFNQREGLAIGAYGLLLHTVDGGDHWDRRSIADYVTSEDIDWQGAMNDADWADEENQDDIRDDGSGFADDESVDEEVFDDEDGWTDDYYDASEDFDRGCYEFMECHLNAVVALNGDELLIAAERGYGYRSSDRGETWESFRFGYAGSMFDLTRQGDCLVAGGLRGHVQRSCDGGQSWSLLETGIESSLMGATVKADGSVVLVGANAGIVEIDAAGGISARTHRRGSDLAMVVEGPDGLIFVGEHGIQHD